MGEAGLALMRAVVYGRVQGVFFRDFVSRQAVELGLTGYARNLPGGDAVEVIAEGERDRLERLIGYLEAGPPAARVDRVVAHWAGYSGTFSGFTIRY